MVDTANIVRDRNWYRMLTDGELIQHCRERTDLSELEVVLLERMTGINEFYLRAVRRDDDY